MQILLKTNCQACLGQGLVAETKTKALYALAILTLVLFPFALTGSALLANIYNYGNLPLPLEWVRDYRDEIDPYYNYEPRDAVVTGCENGDVIVAGTQWTGTTYWFIRVRADGTVAWVNTDSPHYPEIRFFDIVTLPADRYLIISERDLDYNGTGTWLLCIDGMGREVWNQTYADLGFGGYPSVGVGCSDGGALIISSVESNATGNDLSALRIDSNGTALWNVTYPGPWPWEYVLNAASARDGSILFLAYAMNSTSNYCILRCLEPNGALRWNQTGRDLGGWLDSVASGNDGNYVLASGSHAVCLDPEGRERWRFDFPFSEAGRDVAVVACQNGYFFAGSIRVASGGLWWDGFQGLSIDAFGALRWSWSIEWVEASYADCMVAASGNDGLYILPESSCLLMRLPDPPALTSSAALQAEVGYTIIISLSIFVWLGVVANLPSNGTRRRSDAQGDDPRALLKVSFALQAVLLLCWGLLILFFGPVHPYYQAGPGYPNPSTVLLLLLASPVGILNGLLGALVFTALQLGVFPLDRYLSLERQQRHQGKAPSILTCACLVFLIFLGFYAVVWPPYYLAMLPFVNGAILVGFLPKYLLSRWWGRSVIGGPTSSS
jgi:hypothetical protein